jgi:glycosyltransferase-like protein
MPKLRIALFTYSTKPRGGVIHTLELAEALHRLGQDVCVYALDKDDKGFDRSLACQYKLVPASAAPNEIDLLIRQRIQEFVDYLSQSEEIYDCYHAQDCLSANALVILRDRNKIPHLIRTIHHLENFSSPYLQECQRRSIEDADLCFCVSKVWQNAIAQQYQIQAKRVINGVNLQRFSSVASDCDDAIKQRFQIHGNPVYLTIGGIEPRKNSLKLLQAFAKVLTHYPNAQLIIAGGATLFDYQTYRDEFFTCAEDLEIAIGKSLLLPGVISEGELASLYRCADAFAFPSVQEGWGLVILEAIASGLPIITSKQEPFTEFLNDSQAILVDPNSTDAIAQAMKNICDRELVNCLVKNSQSVLFEYTWEKSAQIHLNYYQQLLAHA